MRAKAEHHVVEHGKRAKREAITFTDLPYHVNTEQVGQQIKDAVEKGKITTVADVRDETDRTGIRIVIIGKANVKPAVLEDPSDKGDSGDCGGEPAALESASDNGASGSFGGGNNTIRCVVASSL